MEIAPKIRNYYQNMIIFTQKVISSLKKYKFTKNGNLRAFSLQLSRVAGTRKKKDSPKRV